MLPQAPIFSLQKRLYQIDTSLVHGRKLSDLRGLKSVPNNSVCKLEVYADGKIYKGKIYTRKVNHSTYISKSIEQNSTKLLNVKQLRYPPVEIEDASTVATGLLRESKGGFSTDDLPRMVEAKMLKCGKKKIHETDSCNSGATCKKEAYDIPDNDTNKMVEIQKSQQANVLDDNRLKRIIKYQFNRRVRSCDSNHVAVLIKRRRLTACAKAEESSTAFSKVCRLMSWLIKDEDSEYYQKPREFEYKMTARNKLNQVVLQKHQKNFANDVNRETDEAIIKTQHAEEKNAEEIKVKQVEAGKVKEMQKTEALASSYVNQLASASSAPNDDEVVILTKAKYERLLQRNIVISDGLTTQKVQLLNL